MKSLYVREDLTITEFDVEDVITTSGEIPDPTTPEETLYERENAYRSHKSLQGVGNWF